MANKQLIAGTRVLIGAYEPTSRVNSLDYPISTNPQDSTTLASAAKDHEYGVPSVEMRLSGFQDVGGAAQVDDYLSSLRRTRNVIVSVCETPGADGDIVYAARKQITRYSPHAGAVAQMLGFAVSARTTGGDGVVRGTIMVEGLKTATGNGTIRQLGAVPTDGTLYAWIHALAFVGAAPTLNVKVTSDNSATFAGTPEDRITFAQLTAAGSAWGSDAGAHADDYYRVEYTLGGTITSATFLVGVGIKA